jgi:2-keto-4-pentenoate hydratase/2-oxohepta-3-ene-1,7-dioic acid hydratase in catechol pathway
VTKYARVRYGEKDLWGIVEGEDLSVIKDAPWRASDLTGERIKMEDCRLLAPAIPSKIILVGLNYHDHIKESQSADSVPDEPVIFLKPPTAIIGPGNDIPYPADLDRVDYEGELAAIIGRKAHKVDADTAGSFILGYTCLNDVTARNLQKKDVQWTRGKGFDGFAPVGPWIVSGIDPLDLKIETYLNNQLRQSSNTSYQIWNVFELVSFISQVMTLMPGDLISTGTPKGVGPLVPGDRVKISIQNIGSLENGVIRV